MCLDCSTNGIFCCSFDYFSTFRCFGGLCFWLDCDFFFRHFFFNYRFASVKYNWIWVVVAKYREEAVMNSVCVYLLGHHIPSVA